jgi:excisionase family DNA binding protein
MTTPYMTAGETKIYLRLGSDSALYRLVREHGLPFCRVGRLYRFDVRDVDAWTHGHGSAIEWARTTKAAKRSA